jgi:hypothetical protein
MYLMPSLENNDSTTTSSFSSPCNHI